MRESGTSSPEEATVEGEAVAKGGAPPPAAVAGGGGQVFVVVVGGGQGEGSQQQHAVDEKYARRKSLVQVLYDWLANHNLLWHSLSCRTGLIVESTVWSRMQRLSRKSMELKS
ncbi:hypothetical protein NL676_007013 [Syzygium grande]|nr:hypothetical protein NL676_007013 [Syzygium grande]